MLVEPPLTLPSIDGNWQRMQPSVGAPGLQARNALISLQIIKPSTSKKENLYSAFKQDQQPNTSVLHDCFPAGAQHKGIRPPSSEDKYGAGGLGPLGKILPFPGQSPTGFAELRLGFELGGEGRNVKFKRFRDFLGQKALPSLSSTGFPAEVGKPRSYLSALPRAVSWARYPEQETYLK